MSNRYIQSTKRYFIRLKSKKKSNWYAFTRYTHYILNKYESSIQNNLFNRINILKFISYLNILYLIFSNFIAGGITTLKDKTKLFDPITNMNGTTNDTNTCKKVSTRIDFILCTMGISRFIERRGILPFDYITTTYHQGLYIDISLKLYLQVRLHTTNDISSRLLSLSNHKGVTMYTKYLLKYIFKNDIIKRVNTI